MTRVLITNDDGIKSPGLRRLALAAVEYGLTVVVAAPYVEASGSSASIIVEERDGRVQMEEQELTGLEGVTAYAVAAQPALITLIATRGAFGPPPDLVLSGINWGANTGHAILHSGTVGAALTAAANGRPAMAVSLDVGVSPAGPAHWDTATLFVRQLLPVLHEAADQTILNLNVPDVPVDEVRGLRNARLALFGTVQTNIEVGDGYVHMTVADSNARLEPGTDAALLAKGYATITAISSVFEASEVNLEGLAETAR